MNREATSQISIKGIRDGLLLSLDPQPNFEDAYSILSSEIQNRGEFLRNSRIALDLGGRIVDTDQIVSMQEVFAQSGISLWAVLSHREATRSAARDLGLATRLPGTQMDLEGNGLREPIMQSEADDGEGRRDGANAMVLTETIRSGRSIYFGGHIIIMGDVNPGAEIVADGNIVVWGKLSGLVHAGADGDSSATVSALDLSPTQLRIADRITIAPPADKKRIPVPETAHVKNGQIVAESWSR
ncbi:MAG: septum site-determining protein MinC [Anaerolineae bacterium]